MTYTILNRVRGRSQAGAKAMPALQISLPAQIVSKLSKKLIFWGKNM